MMSAQSFDEFYESSRAQLMLEAYASTGDLLASRSAVRDAFAAAWHHWRKVTGLEDREVWLRPLVLSSAQRRQATRPWHRDKNLDEETTLTLTALSELSGTQRRVLVLSSVAPISIDEVGRIVGLPRTALEQELQSATSQFTLHRDIPASQVRGALTALAGRVERTRWPHAASVRRQGKARRRTFTALGSVAAALALVAAGSLVTASSDASTVSLGDETVLPPVSLRDAATVAAPAAPEADDLLAVSQVERLDPSLDWAETGTGADESVAATRCQAASWGEFGSPALVRGWEGTRTEKVTKKVRRQGKVRTRREQVTRDVAQVSQVVLTSADEELAVDTYATVRAWFTRCAEPRSRLVSTQKLASVGEEAYTFQLRTWAKDPAAVSLGVARSGELTVVTSVSTSGRAPAVRDTARLLSAALNRTCGTAAAGTCAGPPRPADVAPLPIGDPAGLLSVVDLPPVSDVTGPWVGTDPARPQGVNLAATRCDRTSFTNNRLRQPLARTYVFVGAKKATRLGLTQVTALTRPAYAKTFVDEVRTKIRRCAEEGFGTDVTPLVTRTKGSASVSAWLLEVEVSTSQKVPFMMAIMRDGNAVSQVGFTPDGARTMSRGDFSATAERALERLSDLPGWKG